MCNKQQHISANNNNHWCIDIPTVFSIKLTNPLPLGHPTVFWTHQCHNPEYQENERNVQTRLLVDFKNLHLFFKQACPNLQLSPFSPRKIWIWVAPFINTIKYLGFKDKLVFISHCNYRTYLPVYNQILPIKVRAGAVIDSVCVVLHMQVLVTVVTSIHLKLLKCLKNKKHSYRVCHWLSSDTRLTLWAWGLQSHTYAYLLQSYACQIFEPGMQIHVPQRSDLLFRMYKFNIWIVNKVQ